MNNIKLDLTNLLDEIIAGGKYSNLQLNYYFSTKAYNKKEKSFITNIIHTTLKNLIFIDYLIEKNATNIKKRKIKQLLRISVAQFLLNKESDYSGIVFEAVETAKILNKHQTGFVNVILRNIFQKYDQLVLEIPSTKKYSVELSYPQWIINKIAADHPENYVRILKSYKTKSYLSFRINPRKFSREDFIKLAGKHESKILFEVENVFYMSNSALLHTKEFKENYFSVQDASSYLAVKALDVQDGDIVLDACSAPGGKMSAILQEYNPGILVASDIHEHKIEMLKEIKKKNNFTNLRIVLNDAREIEELNEKFDKILLDVPCSGLGVLRKKPEKIYTLESSDIKKLKKMQKGIFDSAYHSLKENGVIIYSTCTFTREENTNNIKYFTEKYPDLVIESIIFPDNVFISKDEFGGSFIDYRNKYLDGFYIAKFRKKGKGEK